MKKFKLILAITMFTFLCGIISCSQEENELELRNNKEAYKVIISNEPYTRSGYEKSFKDSLGIICFSYKDFSFESQVLFGDEETTILNEFVAKTFNELKDKEGIAIFVNQDASFEFYDSIEEMICASKWKKKTRKITRSVDNLMYIQKFELRAWKHAKGRKKGGPCIGWVSNGLQGAKSPEPLYVPQSFLAAHQMDKEISSCQMWATLAEGGGVLYMGLLNGQYPHAIVTFYENGDYTGRSLTFSEVSINKTYSERDYFSSFGFNDLTSSIKVIYDDNID